MMISHKLLQFETTETETRRESKIASKWWHC